MGRSTQELNDGLDDDFRTVIQELQELFKKAATFLHGRGTHTWGTAAKGRARIIVPFEFPSNDLFKFGKEYSIIMRHATPGPQEDSRGRDGAAASIKFFEGDSTSGDGIHDILMNTGRIVFVTSARTFNTMVHTPPTDGPLRKKLTEDGIVLDERLTEAYRTGSFTEFYYHSQICYEMNDTHYLRYRLIPADRGPERGFFPSTLRANGMTTMPAQPDDPRAKDFLRADFRARVEYQGVRYLLQCQVRRMDLEEDAWGTRMDRLDVNTGHEPLALNPSVNWDERYYPWMDVALLSIESNLKIEDMETLNFDANRTHQSINLPLATNPKYTIPHRQADRYASFGHSRALVYYLARKARAESPRPHVG
jgi:hypothetical protein